MRMYEVSLEHVSDSTTVKALESLRDSAASLRVAIVHDWLVARGGAEKVLDALLEAFPQADIYTVVDFMPAAIREGISRHRVHCSLIQRLPFARRHYRHYLPLMPYAIEQLDLRGFDLVISSSHAVAKGVMTHPGQVHVCYCHTPMRYVWDMKEAYLADSGVRFPPLGWLMRYTLHRLRQWDYMTAGQVDLFIANSQNVARRITKYYRRSSAIVPPPVDLDAFPFYTGPREGYYLTASRMVPYKRQDLIIEAFRQTPQRRLLVIGDGPERKRLEQLAHGAENIEILGYLPIGDLQQRLSRARAFVFAADEDFGIAPLEAQACGTPVIAYGSGGARETVRGEEGAEHATGCFFEAQTVASLLAALERFEARAFEATDCLRQARRFRHDAFYHNLHQQLAGCMPALAFNG